VRHGDIYSVDGTKIWTAMAQHATHAFRLARTGQSGGRGISFLLIDLGQPGVSIRPILSRRATMR
jgi:alkylation response protein AidB-like acyl-CoA dehydrogenase